MSGVGSFEPAGTVIVVWERRCSVEKWRQRFHIYMVASVLDRQPDEVKTSVLLHSIGIDALDVYMYNTFPVVDEVSQDDQEESKFDRTMSNFDKYFCPDSTLPMSVTDSL